MQVASGEGPSGVASVGALVTGAQNQYHSNSLRDRQTSKSQPQSSPTCARLGVLASRAYPVHFANK